MTERWDWVQGWLELSIPTRFRSMPSWSARLVGRAMPAYADAPVRRLASSGSTNALFRLGDELLVRLPRQPGGSATIAKEATWLPVLGPLLPVSVPDVVAEFEPDARLPGALVGGPLDRWCTPRGGRSGHLRATHDARTWRRTWPAVLNALRQAEVPTEAVDSPDLQSYRGEPLATMDQATRENIERCRILGGLRLRPRRRRAGVGRSDDAARSGGPYDAALVPRRPGSREPVGA